MKLKLLNTYLDIARRFAQNSYAKRLKVGCVIVTDEIIVPGYNGTPRGWDNRCEDKVYAPIPAPPNDPTFEEQWPFEGEHKTSTGETVTSRYKLVTKPEVLHAEMNCLAKIAKSTLSAKGASMYVTHSPCMQCAKAIYQSGITHVFYETDYRDDDGIRFLRNSGVTVVKVSENTQ